MKYFSVKNFWWFRIPFNFKNKHLNLILRKQSKLYKTHPPNEFIESANHPIKSCEIQLDPGKAAGYKKKFHRTWVKRFKFECLKMFKISNFECFYVPIGSYRFISVPIYLSYRFLYFKTKCWSISEMRSTPKTFHWKVLPEGSPQNCHKWVLMTVISPTRQDKWPNSPEIHQTWCKNIVSSLIIVLRLQPYRENSLPN